MNPYRQVRVALGWTQEQTGYQAGCMRQVVMKTEQCMYSNPPPSLTKALVRGGAAAQMVVSEAALVRGYKVHQQTIREQNKQLFNLSAENWTRVHNWISYRKLVHPTQYGFSQLLAFDMATLQNYERTGIGWPPIEDALSDVLSDEKIIRLKGAIYGRVTNPSR